MTSTVYHAHSTGLSADARRPNPLAVLDRVERRLATITTVDDAKALRDQAEAVRCYAKAAKLGLATQNRAAAIKIRAEHRAGTILAQFPRAQGQDGQGLRTTLVQSGIAPQTAKRWQAIARVEEAVIPRLEASLTARQQELTSAFVYRLSPAHRDAMAAANRRTARNRAGQHTGADPETADQAGARWLLWYGDFRHRLMDVEPGSVDLICTDPPYGGAALHLWTDLGIHAKRLLRPGGVILARAGQLHLLEMGARLEAGGLTYGWLYAEPLPASHARIGARHVTTMWQPWLACSNGPWPSGRLDWHTDVLTPSPRTKRRYVWEQKPSVAAELIATFAGPGAFVVDPMAGTGTSGEAALRVGCRWLGIEQDPVGVAHAAARLRALEAGSSR